jgi:hypothetical protein
MKVALGFKSHSGWAAMVIIGSAGSDFHVVDRRRIELVEENEFWAKQPYHAAEGSGPEKAREIVKRGTDMACTVAVDRMRETIALMHKLKHEITTCAILVPDPMPDWSTDDILAVHFRMHKAEGVLFPEALCRAAKTCRLPFDTIPEKRLDKYAEDTLAQPLSKSIETIGNLGKTVGAPWGKDQKSAALAAILALHSRPSFRK